MLALALLWALHKNKFDFILLVLNYIRTLIHSNLRGHSHGKQCHTWCNQYGWYCTTAGITCIFHTSLLWEHGLKMREQFRQHLEQKKCFKKIKIVKFVCLCVGSITYRCHVHARCFLTYKFKHWFHQIGRRWLLALFKRFNNANLQQIHFTKKKLWHEMILITFCFHFVSLFRKREADGLRVSRLYSIKMLKSSKTLFLWALRLVEYKWVDFGSLCDNDHGWILFGAMNNDETQMSDQIWIWTESDGPW